MEKERSHARDEYNRLQTELSTARNQLYSERKQNAVLKTSLDAAQRALVALRNQSPGRDKSGRFVKKPKTSETQGSE